LLSLSSDRRTSQRKQQRTETLGGSEKNKAFAATWLRVLEILKPLVNIQGIHAFCDASSVIECIFSKNPRCTEKRHLVEIAICREILQRYNITLDHIAGDHNNADIFTKLHPNSTTKGVQPE
jgi:hypothetical protein